MVERINVFAQEVCFFRVYIYLNRQCSQPPAVARPAGRLGID